MLKKILLLATTILSAAAFVSCEDDKAVSEIPTFDRLVVAETEVAPGDTVHATVFFKKPGSYVNVGYSYSSNPTGVSGTFTSTPVSSYSFKFVAPAQENTYTLTLKPKGNISAFAGDKPFLDPTPMGSVKTTFKVVAE